MLYFFLITGVSHAENLHSNRPGKFRRKQKNKRTQNLLIIENTQARARKYNIRYFMNVKINSKL